MLLLIDAGNTNIVFALCDGQALGTSWRIRTDSGRSRDEYASWLIPLLGQKGKGLGDIGRVLISSVVPDANHHLRGLCRQYIGVEPQFAKYDIPDLGIKVDLEVPEDIGADRLVNAAAVLEHYRAPAIVIDFGTATTFDVIDGRGAYVGGAIAPGINLSLAALHEAAAMLPKVSVRPPPSVIGRRTVTAMQSGVYWGYIGLIEGMIGRITEELGEKPFVIATGGLAPVFAEGFDLIDTVDRDLTLKGLMRIAEKAES